MKMTVISLPSRADVIKDEAGFEDASIEWISDIPANVRDTTSNEKTTALQTGFNVEKIFSILDICYQGQGFLKDETDGYIYDINRIHRVTGTHTILLECSKSERGNGVWGW